MLIAVFLLSQAFSCCMVNRKIGEFLATSWRVQAYATASHSCCPNPPMDESGSGQDDTECRKGACCIQDGNQRVPRLLSEVPTPPILVPMIVEILTAVGTNHHPILISASGSMAASGPPIYLATRRILI